MQMPPLRSTGFAHVTRGCRRRHRLKRQNANNKAAPDPGKPYTDAAMALAQRADWLKKRAAPWPPVRNFNGSGVFKTH
jgi:hypothetical protein